MNVGPYEILLPIASGRVATVYLARAAGVDGFSSEVALKLTHAHLRKDTRFANDLIEEAKSAARIRHGNVVSVIDVGDDPQGVYLVMEYVEGDTLAGIRRTTTDMPLAVSVRILLDSLAGLHAAHELRNDEGKLVGVVHRDFSSRSVLVGIDGIARVLDFGMEKAARRGHTQTDVERRTSYMSPEQVQGKRLDRRCDVWAAGIVAWELFAGRPLYRNEEELATLLRVPTVRPPRLRTVNPDVPEAIDVAIAHALTTDPEGRPSTARSFSTELAAACRNTVGIAWIDEVGAWMEEHVAPRACGPRMEVVRKLPWRGQAGAGAPLDRPWRAPCSPSSP